MDRFELSPAFAVLPVTQPHRTGHAVAAVPLQVRAPRRADSDCACGESWAPPPRSVAFLPLLAVPLLRRRSSRRQLRRRIARSAYQAIPTAATAVDESALAAAERRFPRAVPVDSFMTQSGGRCLHVPALACQHDDKRLLKQLLSDVQSSGPAYARHRSGKHSVVYGDALASSAAFKALVGRLCSAFGISLVDCWVNVYRNGRDMKTLHHDNYRDRGPRPTVSLALSLGETRSLYFKHASSGWETQIPQMNGDVFAFDDRFNRHFQHGVPLDDSKDSGHRVSVIVWGNESPPVPLVYRAWTRNWNAAVPLEVSWAGWDLPAPADEAEAAKSFDDLMTKLLGQGGAAGAAASSSEPAQPTHSADEDSVERDAALAQESASKADESIAARPSSPTLDAAAGRGGESVSQQPAAAASGVEEVEEAAPAASAASSTPAREAPTTAAPSVSAAKSEGGSSSRVVTINASPEKLIDRPPAVAPAPVAQNAKRHNLKPKDLWAAAFGSSK
eukprot:TRINITY_DN11100_c0_g1_i1.p1 TRINITY_DN11100_c0_g1~~TRINITY_DN11100_c0_g1_i1.p1  ORF type:complete len:522 (+),score=108.45 TRINITY_DN11100_c0_g1_i1:58-1566(+)